MTIFASDLDNTLIYSYKHDIGNEKRNVELYQSREISYVTDKTYSLLHELSGKTLFVPVTTRSIEQYKRIDFGIGDIKYALVCNGGVLLVNGEKDSAWYNESLDLVKPCLDELNKGMSILEKEPSRKFEIRFIENLFVFTKCENPKSVVELLRNSLDENLVDVFNNIEKIYILPKSLDKGAAIRRFKKHINAGTVISAGDSEFDVSMLENADIGMVPVDFSWNLSSKNRILRNSSEKLFSEFVLENALNFLSKPLEQIRQDGEK